MEQYLKITNINDFIFCPVSIYYHGLYEDINNSIYTGLSQVTGKNAHSSIDNNKDTKRFIYGLTVYSTELKLLGKIDTYDCEKNYLIERKKKVTQIYDGFIFQLYAQCICLREMNFPVESLFIHSLDDNKRYSIDLPEENLELSSKFRKLLIDISNFEIDSFYPMNKEKCINCIYRYACEKTLYDE